MLLEAHTALASAIDRHAVATVGLAPDIVDLLVRLELTPEHHLRGIDISRQLLINPSRASRLIDRAEAAGVVSRQPDPEDRRAQRITFTEEGKQAVDQFLPRLLTVLDRTVFASLTPQEVEVLLRLLTRVRESARAVANEEL
jgi:DNA-binding MarR family transcriptional regulator